MLAIAGGIAGCALRLALFFGGSSLSVDEAALARNILDRDVPSLLAPLDYGQVAPPGFLLAVHAVAGIFGPTEESLRLVPILASLAGIFLFFRVTDLFLRGPAQATAMWMYAAAVPLVFYSAVLKPYSLDVTATLAVVLFSVSLLREDARGRTAWVAATVPVLLCLLSEAVVFVMAASGLVLICDALVRRRDDGRVRIAIVASWACAAVGAYLHASASMTPVDHAYMHRFWAKAFPPAGGAWGWFWSSFTAIFGPFAPNPFDGSLHYALPSVVAALAIAGGVLLVATSWRQGLVVVLPVLLVVIAALLHAFPLGARVGLFAIPLLLLLVVIAVDSGAKRLPTPGLSAAVLFPLVLMAAIPLVTSRPESWNPEHMRPVLRYLADNYRPGDRIWVYYGAGQAFEYYRKWIPIDDGAVVGECDRRDLRAYVRQLDPFLGSPRLWVLMSHDYGGFAASERAFLTAYLGRGGTLLAEFHAPKEDASSGRAEVRLYDLSSLHPDPVSNVRIPRGYPDQRWSCYGTMSPLGESASLLAEVLGDVRS